MNKKSVLYGASILTLGSLITRILGAFYRIPLTRVLGAVGTGMYQMVFPIYALFIVLSTSGMPLAISKLIANSSVSIYDKKKIIKKFLLGIVALSLVLVLVLCSTCTLIARAQGNADLYKNYLVISPAIIFVGIISVLRGYFQGEQNYKPTAISQIVEQIVKIGVGLALAFSLKKYGVEYAVLGAIIGVTASEFVACIVLLAQYKKNMRGVVYSSVTTGRVSTEPVMKTIMPILVYSILMPLSNVIDSLVVVNILKRNFTTEIATAMYGIESGAVSSLVNLPMVLSFALASAILPNIANIKDDEMRKPVIAQTLKINMMIILPCTLGLILFSKPIIALLYGRSLNLSTLSGERLAVSILAMSAVGVFYMSFVQIFSAILQGVGRSKVVVRNLVIALILKYFVQTTLLFIPDINIYGLVIGNLVCYVTVFMLNVSAVRDYLTLENNAFNKQFLSIILSFSLGYCIYYFIHNIYGFIFALLFIIFSYFLSLQIFGEINIKKLQIIKIKNK